jgi:acetyltransferase-like isoleucine patch superfamily enzyme
VAHGLIKSLNSFVWLQRWLNRVRWLVYTRIWGMDIDPTAVVSLKARLDRTNPTGVHIGRHSYVALNACILTHDMTRQHRADVWIRENCFVGACAVILPGVTVGPNSIVAAGAVVTRDVPPNTIAAGNPARVLRSEINVGRYGVLRRQGPSAVSEPVLNGVA